MKNFYSILLLFSLFTFLKCVDNISFTVERKGDGTTCYQTGGMYSFFIEGTFSSEPSVSDEIIIDLESPSNAQAICYPANGFKSITCYIDSCFNILNRTDIIVSVNPPSSSKFTFPNWKEFFYQNNVIIKWVKCLPLGETTFSP